jgi:hypothetical protein
MSSRSSSSWDYFSISLPVAGSLIHNRSQPTVHSSSDSLNNEFLPGSFVSSRVSRAVHSDFSSLSSLMDSEDFEFSLRNSGSIQLNKKINNNVIKQIMVENEEN